MSVIRFTARAYVTISVEAENETVARGLINENIHQADTDYIRTDHWPDGLIAEFSLSEVETA